VDGYVRGRILEARHSQSLPVSFRLPFPGSPGFSPPKAKLRQSTTLKWGIVRTDPSLPDGPLRMPMYQQHLYVILHWT
jgi:hypothetical protein